MNKITSNDLRSCFGIVEFENVAAAIMNFINSKSSDTINFWDRHDQNGVRFTAEEICEFDGKVDMSLFCMFACAGWVNNAWFPKYSYVVSKNFNKRIEESKYLDENIRRDWLKANA